MIFGFLVSYFNPSLLFLKTVINGGDTGSHYPNAVYLKEVLLPQGEIMGWMPGNYAGYPLFYHYFPLPFLLMALLSFIQPMEIAFKLVTVLGTFTLPLFIYLAFKAMKYEWPAPIMAAIFSLAFLFNQGNSMWGGNIPSMMAGEFCYSLGTAFVFLLFGTLYQGVKEKKWVVLNALLIFLTGFSHAYTLIFSFILGGFFLIKDWRGNLKYLAAMYGIGLLFLAFWFLPVLGNIPFTTAFVFRWTISSLLEVFPLVLIPLMFFSLLTFWQEWRDERTYYFLSTLLACVIIYFIGPRIGILDIRFVPFFQLLLAIFAAVAVPEMIKGFKLHYLVPVMIALVVLIWVDKNTTYIRSWIDWNYRGYQSKNTWPVLKGITDYLRQAGGARVEWEHTPLDESLGSIRTSEMLPYFAGRETLEGIHMLGSETAPFVFYLESETSYQSCNPIPDYAYSTFNLKAGIKHFKLFNVDHFVVRSDQVKQAIKNFPEFKLEKKVGDYNIYRLLTNNGQYVEPLVNQPYIVETKDWRDISYQWFMRTDLSDIFMILTKQAASSDQQLFPQTASTLNDLKILPYPPKAIKVKSWILPEAIEIETSEIGRPLLIKVSYHPNWRVSGAAKIYLVSPSFMMVVPTAHKVRLTFEPGLPSKVGTSLSLIGLLLAVSSPCWLKKEWL
jgi:uncharacterized membrane protein